MWWWLLACAKPYTEQDSSIRSELVGDSYDLRVLEPLEGAESVLVLLDGDYVDDFEPAWSAALEAGPRVALVAVGYQGFKTGLAGGLSDETMERRARDFYSEPEPFQDFLVQELLPALEADFGLPVTEPALFGYSAFGWSALTARMTRDADWARVCAGSPSLLVADEPIWSEEALPTSLEGATLATVGSKEETDAAELSALVEAWEAAGLAIQHEVLDGEDHRGAMEPAMQRCLER